MTKILRVGDPHIQVSNLKDSNKLIDFIIETAKANDIKQIEFLGDLYHTHAVMRMEVNHFWIKTFKKLSKEGFKTVCIVGNHDLSGSKEKEGEMSALEHFNHFDKKFNLHIVDHEWMDLDTNIGYLAYRSDKEEVIEGSKNLYKLGVHNCLVCHQTFTGAAFDSGFIAPDAIEPELLMQKEIVSGHIHCQQQVGSCFYQGIPMWDTKSSANQDKGIWIYEHDDNGSILSKEFISTRDVVTPIYEYIIKEGEEVPELNQNARNFLEFHGKTAWINKMKKKYKGLASIRAKPIDRKMVKIDREKSLTLNEFLEKDFTTIDGVTKKDVNDYLERIS